MKDDDKTFSINELLEVVEETHMNKKGKTIDEMRREEIEGKMGEIGEEFFRGRSRWGV